MKSITSNWRVRPLRALAEITLGRQRSPQNAEGQHMVRYLRAANAKDGALDLSDIKEMNFTPSEQVLFALRRGDVLISEGSGSLASVGASATFNGELEGVVCFQNTLLRARPRAGTDARYLAWWCRHAFASGLFASVATGANIFHLSAERVRALPAAMPELLIQRAIADFLDSETARINDLVARKKSMRSRLIEREDAARDRWVSECFERHGEVRLRRLTTVIEQGWSPQCDNFPAEKDEWGVLKTSSVSGGVFRPEHNKRLPRELEPDRRWVVNDGDLLVVRGSGSAGSVAQPAVAQTQGHHLMLSDLLYRLQVPAQDSPFLAAVLRSRRLRGVLMSAIRTDVGQTLKIRRDDLLDVPVPAADYRAQRELVGRLTSVLAPIGELVMKIDKQVAALAEHRAALITAAVTGELDVAGAA